jgi:hypothetical protein
MRCYGLAVVGLLIGSLAAGAAEKPRKPAGDGPAMVVVEVCQVEVDVRKLRGMGIDWKAATAHETIAGNPAWLRKWAELLMENGLARVNASPKLATIAGREAIFDIGVTRETIKPLVIDGKIVVEMTLETYEPRTVEQQKTDPEGRGQLRTSVATKAACQPGQTILLGHELSEKRDGDGKVSGETATLTFLAADIVRPEADRPKQAKGPIDSELRAEPASVVVGARPTGSAVEVKNEATPRRR